jgi:predicted esterase
MKWKGDDYTYDKELVVSQVTELRLFLSWLRGQPEIDPSRIALVGHDFGAMFNAIVTGIDNDIKACVMMAAIPDFSDWFTMRKKMNDSELRNYRMNMSDVAPIKYLEMAKGISFLFQFGKKDQSFVPREKADLLFEKTGGKKEVQWYDEGHALHRSNAATNCRVNWLERELG